MNFLIPAGLPNGDAPVVISSGDGTKTIVIADVSPALFSANTDGKGVVAGNLLRVTTGGARKYEALTKFDPLQKAYVPADIDMGSDQLYLFCCCMELASVMPNRFR